jgi:hypothetical protein
MSRFLTVVLAALACAFAYLVATGIAMPEAASVRAMFVVSSVALLLAAAAIVLALATAARVRTQRIAVQNLAKSVDAAFADLAARRENPDGADAPHSETAAIGMPEDDTVSRQREADRRPIEIGADPAHRAAAPAGAGRSALAEKPPVAATSAGESGLRLRPLLATGGGRVAGFDVVADENGGSATRKRRTVPESGTVQAERNLVFAAIEASGRPDFSGERTLLHVAVTQALLADREAFPAVVEALKRLNGTARSIVLSLPTALMESPAQHSAALAKLAAARSRLAADGWPSSAAGVERLWRSGVSFLRLPAARLLSRDGGPNPIGAASLVQMLAASGITVIATDAGNGDDAAELAKLGVTLMSEATPRGAVLPHAGNGAGDVVHM